jgi:hypothetical protein
MTPFVPTLHDVETTRALLASFGLPDELALLILDEARYWVEIVTESREHVVLVDRDWSLDYSAIYPYIYTPAHPQFSRLKIREITFTVVSHDQGWTTEDTHGTYQTSSWFEVSIIRQKGVLASSRYRLQPAYDELYILRDMSVEGETLDGVCAASAFIHSDGMFELVRRDSSAIEPQRTHCVEMMEVKSQGVKEGEYAWYLQGNEVGREKAIFEGEMVKRYNVTWGCKDNPIQEKSEGAGSGESFIDTLKRNDFICVWARAKVRFSDVRLQRCFVRYNTQLIKSLEARLGEPHLWHPGGYPIHDLALCLTSLSKS